ncbi:glycosyltransferase [Flagellimonas zhangzhouensis]|uniref:Glycosyltransferase involved in cell wall bisynthesis n=1 Tax=Flagellimonas zhangzhouensis TaxID=1073328 RepID=A0A1H2YQJ8_9FLAO|nr:glycosyltransferase [Allomuricauda zhangzhouensis]SDR00325.1 Glycosyltransferase involved in cell wall bisynthesis [Allomuricauda zhangzhouensis]SDX07492.1 Glycosyltransferase involved in cell wall bisynthesis [Allomuricauda zhangzhouensis]
MSVKKNWLFILPTDSLQGSEHIVRTLCTYVIDHNLGECYVLILSKKSGKGWEDMEDKIKVEYLPFPKYFFGLFYLPIYFLSIRKINFDYTFSSQTLINGSLGFVKKMGLLKETKIIVRESNSIFILLKGTKLRIYKFFYRFYSKTALVICQTELMKSQLVSEMPKISSSWNIKTILNPFDFDKIHEQFEDIPLFLQDKKFIVAAGRLAPVKGFDLLIKAFKEVVKEYPELNLVILGEGNERKNLEQLKNSFGLDNSVHLPGYVNNVYRYFNQAEMCVISSHLEGFPNVLLQMMSQNERVVSTTSAGDIENIPGITICEPGNLKALEQAMMFTLNEINPNKRQLFDDFLRNRSKGNFYQQIIKYTE